MVFGFFSLSLHCIRNIKFALLVKKALCEFLFKMHIIILIKKNCPDFFYKEYIKTYINTNYRVLK